MVDEKCEDFLLRAKDGNRSSNSSCVEIDTLGYKGKRSLFSPPRTFLQRSLKIKNILTLTIASCLILTSCKDEPKVRQYTIAKEISQAKAPSPPPAQEATPDLEAQAQGFKEPTWTVPQNWEELPKGKMRKGSFKVTANDAQAEISVLAFPGDVGGLLANINRWAGQISAPELAEADLERLETFDLAGYTGYWVDLKGPNDWVYGAVVGRETDTWFFKMTGPGSIVEEEKENLRDFVESTAFND